MNVFKEESQQGAQLSWQQKSRSIGDRAPDFAGDNQLCSLSHYRAPCTGHYLRLREEAKLLEGGGMEAIDSPKERAELATSLKRHHLPTCRETRCSYVLCF